MSAVWIEEDIAICDNCEGECEFGWGDRDRARFCCVCVQQDAPASYKRWYCDKCKERISNKKNSCQAKNDL